MRSTLVLTALWSVATDSIACGYENPTAISLGILNWSYPEALHIRTAVWQAENTGLLQPRGKPPTTGLLAFYRAAASMNRLGGLLEGAKEQTPATFSIVLIPQVMWTRFVPDGDLVRVMTHAPGPLAGEAVVVTNEKVVRALLDRRLGLRDAEMQGLLRIYGEEAKQVAVRDALAVAVRSEAKAVRKHASAALQEGQ
ncbi:hypothetical protein [Mesorhizobium sp. WSM2239]|uniref:Uncharacterized protein n=2 Tax=unclassified Mesorhizobium TaxID=325217 RepID=A0AAU8DHB7_9HYPH